MNWFEDKNVSSLYSLHRPTYTKEIHDVVMKFAKRFIQPSSDGKLGLLVDVGCGNGQATNLFANSFSKVIANDLSSTQIETASVQNKFSHVTYSVGKAEIIEVDNKSADVVLCATAAHWFDFPNFYKEAIRILKDNGSLCMFSYSLPRIAKSFENLEQSTMDENLIHKHLWSVLYAGEQTEHQQKYRNIFQYVTASHKERNDEITLSYNLNLEQSLNLIRSYGSYVSYMKKQAHSIHQTGKGSLHDPTQELRKAWKSSWGITDIADSDVTVQIKFDIFFVMANGLLAKKV